MVNPSVNEYLHTAESIKEDLSKFKLEQNKLRHQISHLYEENKRLTNELKENVEVRFLQLSENEVGQLQQNLQAAIASKNAAMEMWQVALQQLEKQEELLLGKKSIVATERSEIEKQFLQQKEEYVKGLNVLSEELSNSRCEIAMWKKEIGEKNLELEKYKADIDSAYRELDISRKTTSELSDRNSELQEKVNYFQSSLAESEKALDAYKEKMSNLTVRNTDLLTAVSKLEEQNKKLKSKILIYEKDAKDSVLVAEQAVLQKQEIICKEEQYQNEIKMLKSSIDVEKEKVGMKFKSEIKDIQKKASTKIQNLMSEIQNLHKEIGEKQNLFERANREKHALESKIEHIFSENSNNLPVSSSAFDDMCKRLTMAERTRDEFELKVSSLETTLKETKSSKEQEIQFLLERQNNLNERLRKISSDFNEASSDRIKLSDEVTKLRKRSFDLEKELTNVRNKYQKDISCLEVESRHKIHNLQEQLQKTEEHYKSICSELQMLFEAEFKISNKWKSEVEYLISKSELMLKETTQADVMLKNNITELINILHQNNIPIPKEILINLS